MQLLLAIQKKSAEPSQTEKQDGIAKQLGIRRWHKKTAYVVYTGSTTSASRSSRCRPKSLPVLAVNSPKSLCTETETQTLSFTLPSFAASSCAVCYEPAESTLGCRLLPQNTLPSTAAERERRQSGKNNSYLLQCSHNSNYRIKNNACFLDIRHLSSLPGRSLRFCSPHATLCPWEKAVNQGHMGLGQS